jgi:hypothetical protein
MVSKHEQILKHLISYIDQFNNSIAVDSYDTKNIQYDLVIIANKISDLYFQLSIYNCELMNFITYSKKLTIK